MPDTPFKPTPEYFTIAVWHTPNQLRDLFIELDKNLTTENIQNLRALAIAEQDKRKTLPEQFILCPRCKGYHGQLSNIDNLCEKCESAIAHFRYDNQKS